MDGKQRREFAELRNSELKTARAWALKETAMSLYNYVYEKPARKHFQWWYSWAVRSRLQPIKEVARMLKRRFENIRSEEHTSELQSRLHLVCRLLLEKKKKNKSYRV